MPSRVVHVTSWLSRQGGGIPPVVWALARQTRLLEIDCSVAGLKDQWSDQDCAGRQVPFVACAIKGPGAFGYSPDLFTQVRTLVEPASVVHTHGLWMYPGVAARKCARAAGCPLVVSPHGMLEPWALENSRWKKRLAALIFENRNLRSADCLHALCEAEARNMRNYGLRNPIAVIPNGVDLSESREQKVESSNPPWDGIVEPGRKVLLFLSRIHPKKGLVNLLKAWAQIQRSAVSGQVVGALASDWTLAIAGWDQGGHEAELKCLAGEMGLAWADVRKQKSDAGGTNQNSDFSVSEFQLSSAREMASPISPGGTLTSDLRPPTSVLFLGPQFGDAKSACYANCDAFILPSFSEGVPMVVLEAWAHSKPVVMTPECNLPEGFTTNAAFRIETNIESIVRGLEQLLRSPFSNLCSLGANGRRLVSQQFAWPRIAKQMASVYAWLLGQGPKPDCVGLN